MLTDERSLMLHALYEPATLLQGDAWGNACRMGTCNEMAEALEERMRWMVGATEAADKAKAAADARIEAAKTAVKSDPDPRGGSQVQDNRVSYFCLSRSLRQPAS